MLDVKLVLQHMDLVRARLAGRSGNFPLAELAGLDEVRRARIAEVEARKAEKNESSRAIGEVIKSGGDAGPLREAVRGMGERIQELDEEVGKIEEQLQALLLAIPNLPDPSCPEGADETANRIERTWESRPRLAGSVRDHVDIGEINGILDFERASRMTGARFAVLSGLGARLERALIDFMLDLHTHHHGYREVAPPFMVNRQALFGTGQLPKFEADLFRLAEPADWFLIPTAEVPVTNLHATEILREEDLPLRYVAYTPCFRSEAGSYGKDTRGLIRQHQFDKVELVAFSAPEKSMEMLERLTGHAEEVLKRLELPYRVVCLSTGDLGFSACKTYDLEVWLPSQNTYREISSCSNFGDFQARRAQIRYRPAEGGKPRLVHTLNGSGLAVGRTLVALLENYQKPDGTFEIPSVLKPYLEPRC